MKIVESNNQYKVTIPKELVLAKGWSKGTRLMFVEDKNGNIYLKEIK